MSHFKTILSVILITGLSACASMGSGTPADKRAAILSMKDEVLTQLFREKPYSRNQLESSKGYAVFSNANVKVFFVAAGTGYGLVKDMSTSKITYMNMAEGGLGLGLGVKDYRIVMVFHTKAAMNQFVQHGWTFGGSADASVKAIDKGASVEGEAYFGDVTVYTFTKSGLALQAMVKGTKFWKDPELN